MPASTTDRCRLRSRRTEAGHGRDRSFIPVHFYLYTNDLWLAPPVAPAMARKKTAVDFSIRMLPALIAELGLHQFGDGNITSMTWLTAARGTPFRSAPSFGNWFC